jgi:hypothetical protein
MGALTPDSEARIDAILSSALAAGRGGLFEYEVYEILSALGLEVPRYLFVKDASEVTSDALSRFGHTIVAKMVSPDLPDLGHARRPAVTTFCIKPYRPSGARRGCSARDAFFQVPRALEAYNP